MKSLYFPGFHPFFCCRNVNKDDEVPIDAGIKKGCAGRDITFGDHIIIFRKMSVWREKRLPHGRACSEEAQVPHKSFLIRTNGQEIYVF